MTPYKIGPGYRIGNYRIVGPLGQGGMGQVFKAAHERTDGLVAIKILRHEFAENPELSRRFFGDAHAVNVVDSLGVVKIFDCGYLEDGVPYIVMECLVGQTLGARMQGRPFSTVEALRLGRQMATILQCAHEAGIVHRDLKPDNVMLIRDVEIEGGERPKILDFGIAKMAWEDPLGLKIKERMKTRTGTIMGTPAYMSPEQCRDSAHLDERADVYSLGVMLFEMLAGRRPFAQGSAVEVMSHHMHTPPPHLWELKPALPPPLGDLIHSMLDKLPAGRPTMMEVAAELERIRAALDSDLRTQLGQERQRRRSFAANAKIDHDAVTHGLSGGPPAGGAQTAPLHGQAAQSARPPRWPAWLLSLASILMVVMLALGVDRVVSRWRGAADRHGRAGGLADGSAGQGPKEQERPQDLGQESPDLGTAETADLRRTSPDMKQRHHGGGKEKNAKVPLPD